MAGTKKNKNQNVYIASLPRSASTLLGMILNQGKQCAYIGESFYWKKLNPKNEVCTCKTLGCKVLLKAHGEIIKDQNILKITDTLSKLDRILQNSGSAVKNIEKKHKKDIKMSCLGFEKEADIFRKIFNKKNIINSSSNIIIGKELSEKFNWKVILLLRDPRGVIYSMKEAAERHKNKIPKDIWINYAADFIKRAKQLKANKNVLIVECEKLCDKPIKEIRRICKFLGIDFQKKMLKYRRDRGHVLMANHMRFGNSEIIKEDKKWINGLTDLEKQKISGDKRIIKGYGHFGYNF